MVDIMGRVSAIYRSNGASVASDRHAHTSSGICDNGALASMDSHRIDGDRDLALFTAVRANSVGHLTALLAPLDKHPDKLAARLLSRFGSLAAIVGASGSELKRASRGNEAWLNAFLAVRQLLDDGRREELVRTNLDANRRALIGHLQATLGHLQQETAIAIFADRAGQILAEDVVANGNESFVLLSSRHIFGRALKLDARRIVLAHNHPSGSAEPSARDIEQTLLFARQAVQLGIVLNDHVVVTRRTVVSMKERGLL